MRETFDLFQRYGRKHAVKYRLARWTWRLIVTDTWQGFKCFVSGHRREGVNEWCQQCGVFVGPRVREFPTTDAH